MYRYFSLNIRHKEKNEKVSEAVKWIDLNKVPIFFGESTIDECLSGEVENSQAMLFCEIGNLKKVDQSNCRIVTIDSGFIYIYAPEGRMKEEKTVVRENGTRVMPKTMAIRMIKKLSVSEAPLILSSMKVNQAISR